MRNRFSGRFGAPSLLVIAVAISTAAQAQETPPSSAQASSNASSDILVTATRRQERAIDVPIAVTSLSGEKLAIANSSGLDVRFLSSRVPSLQIESSFGRTFPRFYIRGLGNTDYDANAIQPVSVVYDDVALENPMLKSFPIFDLNSVEVLRGPQGTLFGRNTPAGVVKLDSAKPGDVYNGHASLSAGTYGTVNAEMAVGGPLGNGFGVRVAGLLQRRDNWVTNDSTSADNVANKKLEGYRDASVRALLSYENGPFEALLNVHARDLDGTPRIFRAGLFKKGSNHFTDGFDPEHVSLDGYTSQSLQQFGSNLHLSYELDNGAKIMSITAYEQAKVESTGDIDGGDCYSYQAGCTLGDLNVGAYASNTGGTTRPYELSQELRYVSSDTGPLTYQGGIYYFHQILNYNELAYNLGGGDTTQDITHHDKNENISAFASAAYKLTDKLSVRGGLRYSHDDKRDYIGGYFGSTVYDQSLSTKANTVTWDASTTYAIQPSLSVYARVATGYLAPAISDRVTYGSVQSVAEKQKTISAEAGIKGDFGRSANFSLTAYWNRTKNFQLTYVGGTSNTAGVISADHVLGYGLEAEFAVRPIDHLEITASGSYNYTEIQSPGLSVGYCSGGCTVLDPINADGKAVIDGNSLPQAPRWIANATLRYGVPVGNGELYFYTDWAYRSAINYFLYEAAEFRGRSLLEGGVRVGYKFDTGLEVAVFSRNVLNQIRAVGALDFNNLVGMINDPRTIGGEIKFAF
ncbi:TonB-dependent receptor [Novosphingobium sp. Rr 2-17]|uniref:TonB-dependent receptor n=1 Tax=Novosphingobium sp. Rr 2-17 TaxID=555793 RepID=UPI0002698EEB|nr:TonB-dependent receptor [Novosphingobium sp. Rr 2-17]EIZ78660.1 TonB-dependent receptor [Novosphingobium sp. Rr 2-17]